MAQYITGSSNYPYDNDLYPTGVGVNPTLAFVLDEVRANNGVVTQSGNAVAAEDVNVVYSIVNKLENVLGYNPAGNYPDVSTRLNNIQLSGAGAYLHLSGGNIFGPVIYATGATLTVTNLVGQNLVGVLSGNTSLTATDNLTISTASGKTLTLTGAGLSNYVSNFYGTSITTNSLSVNSSSTLFTGNSISFSMASSISFGNSLVPSASGSLDLGSPSLQWRNIYATGGINASGVSNIAGMVAVTGSSLSGTFTMQSGAAIVNSVSGVNNLGSSNYPFANVYTKTINATYVSGLSPVTFLSNIVMNQGTSITVSGTGVTMGSLANPINTIYATNIIGATGLDPNGLVQRSGSSVFGNITFSGNANLVLNSGSNITVGSSGNSQIGSTGSYLGNVYTNAINNSAVGHMIFNEMLTGTVGPSGFTFWLSHTPSNNYAMIFVNGIYQPPTVNYVFSGNAIVFTGTNVAPTAQPYAGFYVY